MKKLTALGNNIVRSFDNRNGYINSVTGMVCLYDNLYTAAYYTDLVIISYCEGDVDTVTGNNLTQERAAYLEHHIQNEG